VNASALLFSLSPERGGAPPDPHSLSTLAAALSRSVVAVDKLAASAWAALQASSSEAASAASSPMSRSTSPRALGGVGGQCVGHE